MARPCTRMTRRAAVPLLVLTILAVALPAGAAVLIFGRAPQPQLLLVVGTASQGVVDTVTMEVPAASLGNPAAPVPGSQPIDVTILARAPPHPGSSSPGWATFTLSVDSSEQLRSADNHTIPMSEIAWTTDAGDIPSGVFTGASGQVLLSATPDRLVRDTLRFRYLNSTVPPAGTYTARVRYTLSLP